MKLRLLTRNEAILAGLCAVLLALALRPRPAPRTVVQTRTDTVTLREIAHEEPPVKPSIIERIVYREVKPTTVQVAPGAGDSLLAAVCDTARDTVKIILPQTEDKPSPALPYTEKGTPPWTPWGAYKMTRTLVGRDGLEVLKFEVRGGYEVRYLPERVIREQRGWRRVLKPLPFVALTFAAGYAAGTLTR